MQKRIVGYGVCGAGEAKRYLKATLDEFKRLCDDTIILLNNVTDEEREMIASYDFLTVEDDREWGKNQHKIKQDFLKEHVSKLNPDITICLDMDEVFYGIDREEFENLTGQAWYVYIANLWDDGWSPNWSFWNVRAYSWEWREKLGDSFFEFENRPLHCGLAPKWAYYLNYHAPVLLLHYGLKEKADRMKKVKRYEKYDPNKVYRAPSYYEALKTEYSEPFDPDDLLRRIKEDVRSMKQPEEKKMVIPKEKNEYLVKREADGFVFSVDEKLLHNQLKQKYKGQGFVLINKL